MFFDRALLFVAVGATFSIVCAEQLKKVREKRRVRIVFRIDSLLNALQIRKSMII